MDLKAWRLTEFEFYAAETLEDAVALAMQETGLPRDDVLDVAYAGSARLGMRVLDYAEDGSGDYVERTLGDLLAEMKAPGLLCAREA